MQELMISTLWFHDYRPVPVTLALITVLIWALGRALSRPALNPLTRAERLNENTWTIRLEGNCYLDFHMPLKAIALACPGVDYIKLWPRYPLSSPGRRRPFPDDLPGGYAAPPDGVGFSFGWRLRKLGAYAAVRHSSKSQHIGVVWPVNTTVDGVGTFQNWG